MKDFTYAKRKSQPRKPWYIVKIGTRNIYLWSLPLLPFDIFYNKIYDYRWKRNEWSEKKAAKVLDCVLPYVLEYDEKHDVYYHNMNWHMKNTFKRHAPLGTKTFVVKHYYEISNYLVNEYQKDGYEKRFYTEDGEVIFIPTKK